MKSKSWLEIVSGKSEHWWIDAVEEILRKHSVPRNDGTMQRDTYVYDANLELFDLVRSVVHAHLKIQECDAVILHSSILSVVLATWVKAVTIAKCHDPRRDIEGRKSGLHMLEWWCRSLVSSIVDTSIYKKAWPEQKWRNPFIKKRKAKKKTNADDLHLSERTTRDS